MKIEALLIGVEEYSNREYNLYGCVNDVNLIRAVLSSRYESIRYTTLLNQSATRDNIIKNILELSKSMRAGETFLLYFSGHGSHEKIADRYREIEDDLLNETLVCYDSRGDNGVGDLTDKEISYLLSKFHRDIEVVVIYDSCHSGGGTRIIEEDEIEYIRTIGGRDAIRDFGEYCFAKEARDEGWYNDLSQVPKRDHIFVSACQSYQSAVERPLASFEDFNGVFTYFLSQVLKEARGEISYHTLVGQVRRKIREMKFLQKPNLESFNRDVNSLFLGERLQEGEVSLFGRDKSNSNRDDNHLDEIANSPIEYRNRSSKPVILIVSADSEHRKRHLSYLDAELKKIKESLIGEESREIIDETIESNPLFKLVFLVKADIQKLVDTITKYQRDLVLLHYAGHASSDALFLKSEYDSGILQKANRKGLVPILSRCKSLKLVFLNGCSTQDISSALIEHGVPVVIGTTAKVNDLIAGVIAYRFYHSLGQGLSIDISWLNSKDEIMTRGESYHQELIEVANRSLELDREEESSAVAFDEEYYWRLDIKEGSAHILDWNLPSEANNPLFGLSVDRVYEEKLPPIPFDYMKRYREHEYEIFFGRGREIRQLYNLLQFGDIGEKSDEVRLSTRASIILFYGQTGVGKSSILQAGLLPRVDSQYTKIYHRRSKQIGLLNGLRLELEKIVNDRYSSFEELWIKIEQKSGKPLLVILDQVEECFTKPLDDTKESQESAKAELQELNETMQSIFYLNQNSIRGKVIYSYRKEYHPDIYQSLKDEELGVKKLFVQPMQRSNIEEVVAGLYLNEKLFNYYKLKRLEEWELSLLSTKIADHLLQDETSSITPMLQIIMRDMWDEALKRGEDSIYLTVDSFERVKYSGLIDFVNRQFEKLKREERLREYEKNGLILDLLYSFITSFDTAQTHSRERIIEWYRENCEEIESVLDGLERFSLLKRYREGEIEKFALSHDTFAPIVRNLFMNSQRDGQKARRIFNSSLIGNREMVALSERDLETIDRAKKYIRAFNEQERELIEISNRHRRSKKFLKRGEHFLNNGELLKAKVAFALAISTHTDREQFDRGVNAYNDVKVASIIAVVEERSLVKSVMVEYDGIDDNNQDIVSWSVSGRVELKDRENKIVKIDCHGFISGVAYSKNRREIVTWSNFHDVREEASQSASNNQILQTSFDEKARFVDRSLYTNKLKVWDVKSGRELAVYKYDRDIDIREAIFCDGGKKVIYWEESLFRDDIVVRVWDIYATKEKRVLDAEGYLLEAEVNTGISSRGECLLKNEWYQKRGSLAQFE